MDGSTLEMLLPELQAAILSYFPTLDSLYSSINASPRLFQVFASRKQQILSNMAMRQFHPAVLPDALATVKASQLGDSPSRDSVLEFLGSLPQQYDVHTTALLPEPTAVALCQLHENISFFVAEFAQHALSIMTECSDFSAQREFQAVTGAQETSKPNLSELETGRLQRAFCRFEVYRYLFAGCTTESVPNMTVAEQAHLFLERFPKWEVEEIACVRDYLMNRLCEVFNSMEDEFVEKEIAGNLPVRAESILGRWEEEDRWFSSSQKLDHDSYMEYMLSLGLPFLRQAFRATGEERKGMIISNSCRAGPRFLSKALHQPQQDTEADRQDMTDHSGGVTVSFAEDRMDEPNEGWVWGHDYKPALGWASGLRTELRRVGYVFWDHKRMKESGVLSLR
jgi:hypothetical protein